MRFFSNIIFWLRRKDGSVAVEFALVSIPFIYTTIAIIELSLFFAASNMLEAGVNTSSRLIRTGQLQQSGSPDPEALFRENICEQLFILIECDNVQIEVVAMPGDSFSEIEDYQPEYDENGVLVPREFDAGGSDDVVMIRAYYRYQLMTPIFAQIFSKEPDNSVPMMSTVILQSEPYEFGNQEEEI